MEKDFFEKIEEKYGLFLNKSQIEAVKHNRGPALVLAVPGAGKTTVLISRIAYLVSVYKVSPSSILSITFSKSSAVDMLNRFDSTFGKDLKSSPKFSTIHSFAYFVIKEYCRQEKVSYKLVEESGPNGKINILKTIYSEINNGFLSEDKLEELVNGIGYVKNMMIPPEEFKSPGVKNFPDIFREYERYKRENGLIDFDDMLSLCLDILKSNKAILDKYRKRYAYVQVDEGQDTSNIQHEIISLLAAPLNNLFIVADDDQSIYGFRGANPEYLLNYKEKYRDAVIFNMNQNYRSTVDIVDIANKVIKKNKSRYDKDLISAKGDTHPVNVLRLPTQEDQYSYIVDNLDPSALEDTAVLFRNNISAIPLVDIFDRKNIEFSVNDSKLLFFNHWLLKDIVSFLKLAIDQSDASSFERIYYKMKGYISKRGVSYAVSNLSGKRTVFSSLESFPELKPFQRESVRKLSIDFARLGKKKPLEAIEFIESDLDYLKYLNEKSEFLGYGLDSNLKLLAFIKSVASRCASILDFIDRLRELKGILSKSKDKRGVFVSTMHSAKGLEFESVFVIDLINGDFPSVSSIDASKQDILEPIEEERRLFYVAMTRAKKNLHLLGYNYKNNCRVASSMFLNEVESVLSESKNESLRVNETVVHSKFGKGTIVDMDDTSILIDFESHGEKQLAKEICIKNNLLQIESEKS